MQNKIIYLSGWILVVLIKVMLPLHSAYAGDECTENKWKAFEVTIERPDFSDIKSVEPDFLVPTSIILSQDRELVVQFAVFDSHGTAWSINMEYDNILNKASLHLHSIYERNLTGNNKELGSTTISPKLANVIFNTWVNTLLDARYSKSLTVGADGETYYFSAFVPGPGLLRGEAWSPTKQAPPKWLVAIGLDMRKLIETTDPESRAVLENSIMENAQRIMAYLSQCRTK